MCLELMLLAVNIQLIAQSIILNDLLGEIFSLIVLTVAASESAIGLAILVVFSRSYGSISILYSKTQT
jgi:NADH-quinone oxidoreductase subunit K